MSVRFQYLQEIDKRLYYTKVVQEKARIKQQIDDEVVIQSEAVSI